MVVTILLLSTAQIFMIGFSRGSAQCIHITVSAFRFNQFCLQFRDTFRKREFRTLDEKTQAGYDELNEHDSELKLRTSSSWVHVTHDQIVSRVAGPLSLH